jgi:hypothetical protein
MYACLRGIERGFFEGVCTLSNATAPTPQHERTGALPIGLRSEEDHAPSYRERRLSLG